MLDWLQTPVKLSLVELRLELKLASVTTLLEDVENRLVLFAS